MTKEKLLTKKQIGVYQPFSDKADAKYFYKDTYYICLEEWCDSIKIKNEKTALKLDEEIKNSFEGKTKEYAVEHLPEVLNKFFLSLN